MRFKRRLRPEARVDLIPMIDVVFQLVIFFMVSSTFLLTPGIDLVLPSSTTAEPVVMSELVVTIVSQEEIYVNKDRFTLAELDQVLSEIDESMRSDLDSVIIEGDRDASYDLMVKVLDKLRLYGFTGVSLKLRSEELLGAGESLR